MTSQAIGSDRVSKVVGYLLKKGNFATTSPNLPQRIAILGEANEVNQATLDTTPKEIISAKQAGELYGYGSPIYQVMRILKPLTSDGVGGIPIWVYPQAKAVGASAKEVLITPSGSATGNGTHYVKIAGRDGLDGQSYAINVAEGDDAADISEKIADAVNAVLGAPVTAYERSYDCRLITKWKGLTAQDVSVSVDTGDDDLGLSYSVSVALSGSGTPSVSAALAAFGNVWNTIVINTYGTVESVMSALESFNGVPDDESPTGRYGTTVFKPFIAFTGTVVDDPSDISDAREDEVTIALCPAPLSSGLPMEAAANYAYLFALQAQNNVHLDISGKALPDMPVPDDGNIGSMASYDSRDQFVKKGCSTVEFVSGKYQVCDFVTTYHPEGEIVPQFRYCRNLNIDWNVRYGYFLKEQLYVVEHAIAGDNDVVDAGRVIKPKQWIGILSEYADELAKRAIIVEPSFMQSSIEVGVGETNPDRFETFFRYKRSGFVRQAATTAEAGFFFGN